MRAAGERAASRARSARRRGRNGNNGGAAGVTPCGFRALAKRIASSTAGKFTPIAAQATPASYAPTAASASGQTSAADMRVSRRRQCTASKGSTRQAAANASAGRMVAASIATGGHPGCGVSECRPRGRGARREREEWPVDGGRVPPGRAGKGVRRVPRELPRLVAVRVPPLDGRDSAVLPVRPSVGGEQQRPRERSELDRRRHERDRSERVPPRRSSSALRRRRRRLPRGWRGTSGRVTDRRRRDPRRRE